MKKKDIKTLPALRSFAQDRLDEARKTLYNFNQIYEFVLLEPGQNLRALEIEREVKDLEEYFDKLNEAKGDYSYESIQATVKALDKDLIKIKSIYRNIDSIYFPARVAVQREKIEKKQKRFNEMYENYSKAWKPAIEKLQTQKKWPEIAQILAQLPGFEVDLDIDGKWYRAASALREQLDEMKTWEKKVRATVPALALSQAEMKIHEGRYNELTEKLNDAAATFSRALTAEAAHPLRVNNVEWNKSSKKFFAQLSKLNRERNKTRELWNELAVKTKKLQQTAQGNNRGRD